MARAGRALAGITGCGVCAAAAPGGSQPRRWSPGSSGMLGMLSQGLAAQTARLAADWGRLAERRKDEGQGHTSLPRLQQVPALGPPAGVPRPRLSLRANGMPAKRDVVKSAWGRQADEMIWKVRSLSKNMAGMHGFNLLWLRKCCMLLFYSCRV